MNDTKEIVRLTVEELKRQNLIRTSNASVFQKTEKILYVLADIEDTDDPFIQTINDGLERISDDSDFEIIELKYFEKLTHEEIAEAMGIDPKTVTRRKNRIIKRLSFILFPSEAIHELINN